MGATRVVNVRHAHKTLDRDFVYIGRARAGEPENPWGNPFSHLPNSLARFLVPRNEVIPHYEAWLRAQPELVERARRELTGKVLGCFCRPATGFRRRLMCHGQILAGLVDDVDPRTVD